MNRLLILFVAGWMVGADPMSFSGLVTDKSGQPLVGVRVSSLPWDETTTNQEGHFAIHLQDPRQGDFDGTLVRFSLRGYSPRTVTVAKITGTIQLAPALEPEWRPPICDRTWKLSPAIGRMRFVLPKGARVRQTSDVDYTTADLRFHGGWVMHGTGGNWSWGFPIPRVWSKVARVEERDVVAPWGTVAEYRGVQRDGSYWRFVGWLGETVSYDGVSEATAKHLDQIIDTLCWG